METAIVNNSCDNFISLALLFMALFSNRSQDFYGLTYVDFGFGAATVGFDGTCNCRCILTLTFLAMHCKYGGPVYLFQVTYILCIEKHRAVWLRTVARLPQVG
jgi:hypothetical protein